MLVGMGSLGKFEFVYRSGLVFRSKGRIRCFRVRI